MRYFIELAYNGTRLCGWQRQPNAPSVQQTIEDVFSMMLRQPVEITGCGRTDTGVHAQQYFAHFDFDDKFPKNFLDRADKLVGKDIALRQIMAVNNEAHARFDATSRSYEYHISFQKSPFFSETAWFFTQKDQLDFEKMQKTADLLRGYSEFAPFCKTHSDAQTMRCAVTRSEWIFSENGAVFHISANRFLRGMVRLIVGACVNVGLGQITIDDVKKALDNQEPLKKSYSVPPTGLFLTDIRYPFFNLK
ncbi:MAG: tRNA pseudouridine(38-40) synthase TruA [Saprospiraceae bacterium]|nr:tRNA pseudouridine(38-40) synthase TruA [Saprospiraceae bacterium]